MKQIKLFFWVFSILVAFDALFLGVFAKNFYRQQLGELFRAPMFLPAAFMVWALLAAGLIVFVLPRAFLATTLHAFLYGAFYGLVVYGVYDLTNFAILAQWPIALTIVDILWGVVLHGIVTVLMCELARMIK